MSEGEGSAPAEAGTTESEATETTVAERPDYVPEKFWDSKSGNVRMEDVFKSYTEIEKKGRARNETMRENILAEIEEQINSDRPEAPEYYVVRVPDTLKEQMPEGMDFEFNEADPMLNFWKQHAFENGFSQEEFEQGISAFIESSFSDVPNYDEEISKLGENANERINHIAMWAKKTFSEPTYQALSDFAITAQNTVALEEIMRLQGEPAFAPGSSFGENNKPTLEGLRSMQADQRYWHPTKQDPEFIKKVEEGFRQLVS